MSAAPPLVVIGGGLASARLVKAYREAGGEDAIRLLSADSAFPYHRPPLSKRYLRGEVDADSTLVEAPSFYDEHGCDCDLEETVTAVREQELELASGERVPFERLVLASGASPRRLDVHGSHLDGIQMLRTLADSTAIREHAADAEHAVVVGSNFIGLETAASLRQLGLEVTLVDRGKRLFRVLQTPAYSDYLADLYRDKGVELLFEDEIAEFHGNGRLTGVLTTSGETRPAELAIVGIGVAPNVGFLEGAGVEIADGVVVNERFETSRPGVYAVGDVARFWDPVFGRQRRIEHWSNANYQGTELGKILAGEEGGYDTVSSFFSEIFGASVRFFGDAEGHDDVVLHGDFHEGKAVALHTADGTIVSALTMGAEDDEIERIKELIRSRAAISDYAGD